MNIVNIHHDDISIGEEGAEYLCKLGNFKSWAFLPTANRTHWSSLRYKGFEQRLSKLGKDVSLFRCPFTRNSKERELRLAKWLLALPKPTAIMAACDDLAVELVPICKSNKLQVPQQVSILGVDNDRLLCETSRPPISSIAPDHIKEGKLAACVLIDLLKGKKPRTKEILCNSKTIISRESTSSTPPATTLIQRTLEYIKIHASEAITPTFVAKQLGVSRSLLDLRFRQFHVASLATAIRTQRLAEVRHQLLHSSAPIISISKNLCWSNPNALKNLFRRHYRISMSEMRKQYRKNHNHQ